MCVYTQYMPVPIDNNWRVHTTVSNGDYRIGEALVPGPTPCIYDTDSDISSSDSEIPLPVTNSEDEVEPTFLCDRSEYSIKKKLDKRMQLLARVFGLVRPAPQHSSDKAQDTLVRSALLSSRRHCS